MRTTPSLRIGLATLTTLTLWLTPWMESRPTTLDVTNASSEAGSTPHTFSFRTESDEALTEWALARFERAGLHLPPLAIAFHNDKEPCNGRYGYYRSGTPAHVDICGFNWNRFLLTSRKTILHELGHAWEHQALTEGARQTFLHFRGLDTWRGESTPWEDQGSEHAAEVIAWALMDEEMRLGTIADADPGTLAKAYELLTSTHAP